MAKASQFVVMTIRCPHCKTEQKVHVGVNRESGHMPNQYYSAINCGHEFDVTLPDKIVGPFPA
jgi:transposase-like protein